MAQRARLEFLMRYFTKEYVTGALSDREFDARLARYLEYRDSIWLKLPPDLRRAHHELAIHDAKIAHIRRHQTRQRIEMRLLCQGFNKPTPTDVTFIYTCARVLGRTEWLDALSQGDHHLTEPVFEILYQEVEMSDSGFEHRFVTAPFDDEFGVEFGDFSLRYNSTKPKTEPKVPHT
jgi:hypothetical protein